MAVFSGNGSNTTPSFTFSSDTDTGMYRVGADQLGIATAGSLAMTVGATQNVGFGIAPDATARLYINGTSLASSAYYLGNPTGGYSGGIIQASTTSKSIIISADPSNAGANSRITFQQDNADVGMFYPTKQFMVGGTLPSSPNILLNGNSGDITAVGKISTTDYLSAANLGTIYQATAQVDAPRPTAFSLTLSDLVNRMGCGTIYFWAFNTTNISDACATGAYHFVQNPLNGTNYSQTVAQAITNVGAANITSVSVAKSGTWDITISGAYTGNVPIRVGACAVGTTLGFNMP